MKKIHQIKIKNFKAFQQEQIFDIKGKHVLAYGNNGSGKSSLFWALYTLTQSSIKIDSEIKKYFTPFIESNRDTHQSLRNVFADDDEDSFVELTTINEHGNTETHTISSDIINTNKDSNTLIQELNQASDFINYKLLHNFYTATHKQEINLWPVFERDIFPFLMDDVGIQVMLTKIESKTSDITRTPSGQPVRGKKAEANEQELDDLNTEIIGLLAQIQTNANDFIKKHFFDNKDVLRISLEFSKKFSFVKVKSKLWEPDKQADRYNKLQIKLIVEMHHGEGEDHNWQAIHRVQSFLNEAQLTRIAIGIRIGALRTRVQTTDFKILALDDMLISLDMSNRMPFIKMILNHDNDPDLQFFDGFQKIILTHDKGFYELIKRQTSPHEWQYYNFHTKENNNSPPTIKIDRTHMEKAQAYLADGEYDACGNELRKETEEILAKYLKGINSAAETGKFEPLSAQLSTAINKVTETHRRDFERLFVNKNMSVELIKKLQTDYSVDTSIPQNDKGKLTGLKKELVAYLIKQYELQENHTKLVEDTQDILKRVMNPSSHSSLIPFYGSEMEEAIAGIIKLKELFENDE